MLQHFNEYGYQGVFFALIAAGFGFPDPGGAAGHHRPASWSGTKTHPEVVHHAPGGHGRGGDRRRGPLRDRPASGAAGSSTWRGCSGDFVPPEKRAEIEKNFHDRGIMVLLGARLLPGIRTPIFIMAGVLRVPFGRFLLADAHLRHPDGERAVLAVVHADRPGAGHLQQDQRVSAAGRSRHAVGSRRALLHPEIRPQPARSRPASRRTCRRSSRSRPGRSATRWNRPSRR